MNSSARTAPVGRAPTKARSAPAIVTADEWERERAELLEQEKAATRTLDSLAARRRRLPMTRFDGGYQFETPAGTRSLLDLFDGRNELVVYQFMDNGPDHYCPGCSWFTENMPATAPGLLADNGITWITVSDMPLEQMTGYWSRMGWTVPYASTRGSTFAADCGAGSGFLLSVFLRVGDEVYRTYSTTARGIDRLAFVPGVLDLTAYGRREDWEDSPAGWPQSPTYVGAITMAEGERPKGFGRFG